jgi:tetratricopeptide (TPR) repeat protein
MRLDSEKHKDNPTRQYYYGRQLYYKGDFECITPLEACAEKSGWPEEKCLALCFIANLYSQKGNNEMAHNYFKKAMEQSDRVRDPYWGLLAFTDPKSPDALELATKALEIDKSIYFDSNPNLYSDDSKKKLVGLVNQHRANQNDSLGRPQLPIQIHPRELVPPVRF